MPDTVHVIHRKGAIEDHYDAPCAVAKTAEGARTWIRDLAARNARLHAAKKVGDEAEAAWSAQNPDPFTEPPPPRPKKWPGGIGKNDPRYPALRAQRDAENAAWQQWGERKGKADAEYRLRTEAVYREAVLAAGFSEEDVEASSRWLDRVTEDDYYVEEWTTVD